LDTRIKSIAALCPEIISNVISRGGHFEIQYGGHKERISSGPISENVHNILMYICAKFGLTYIVLLRLFIKPFYEKLTSISTYTHLLLSAS